MESYYFYYPFYFLILALLCYILLRISLLLLSYYLQRRFQVNLTVRSIRFDSLRTINISCPNLAVNINIEHFSLSSKWFNSKYNCLLVFKFSDIRLEGDITATLKRFADFQSINRPGNDIPWGFGLPLKRIAVAIVNYLSSNFQVSLHNTSLMQLGGSAPSKPNAYRINDCLLHSTIQLIQFGFAKKSKSEIIFQVDGFSIKVLKSDSEEKAGKACLVQMSFPFRFVFSLEDKSAEILVSSSEMIVYDMLKLVKMIPKKMNTFEVSSISKNGFTDQIVLAFDTILKTSLIKSFSFKLNACSIKLVREYGKKELTFFVEPIELFVNKVNENRLESSFTLANVLVQDSESIIDFSLSKCVTLCKIEKDQFSGKLYFHLLLEISTCSFVIHYTINHWFQYFVNLFATTGGTGENAVQHRPAESLTSDQIAGSGKNINKLVFLMVVNDVSVSLKRSQNYAVMVTYGLKHLKTTCVRNIDDFNRETSIELLLETFWCWNGSIQLKPSNPNSLKKYNEKHVPLFMSTLLLKFGNITSSDLRIHCVMDGLQVSLEYYLNYLENLDLESIRNFLVAIRPPTDQPPSARYNLSGQINFTSVNIFTSQLMMRIDSMACDLDENKITNSINGFGVNGMYAPSATLACLKASELVQSRIIYFSVMRINFVTLQDANELMLSLTEEIFVRWSPLFHVNALELWQDFYQMYQNLAEIGHPTKRSPTETEPSTRKTLNLNLKLDGKISLGVLLSDEGDTMRLETEYLTVTFTDSRITSSKCELFTIFFNQVLNCQVEHLLLVHLSAEKNYLDRKSFPLTETEHNDALELNIEKVSLKFPYQFNFAHYFNEKFLAIVKWLRTYHGREPKPGQRISSDFILKLQHIRIELEDDWFEVRLNNNYKLMEDEYKESRKRWAILMERRRKNNIKIDDLKQAFDRQNANTYVERSQQIYNSNQMCRQLFTIKAENVQLHLISDTSYDRYEKKVKLLRSIDCSPMPEDIRFSTIWCRQIFCIIGHWLVSLRDFPQPMLNSKKLYFKGVVLGAEQEASARAKRTSEIDMGPNFSKFKVERSMTTMKFYHDIASNIGSLIYTHGACWEPILQQVNLSFELIFRPSNDPSPSLPWWDKLRFLFHGPLNIVSKQISIVFHASLDPYNSTELIEFSFFNSIVRMDTGKISISGDLDAFVHAASKYDECRIIHLPDVDIVFTLNWECSGNKNDHHSVMPCARDKLPEYTCNQVHDSYRAFRSHHLNLSASIDTKEESDAEQVPDDNADRVPMILIYNSTLRWLENKLFMFTGFPRLTRRGKLYKNTRPRKMPFTRLFKTIRLTICMHKLEITYWSSFSRNRGFKIASHRLSHSAQHRQTFIKINDNLKHRPKPVWELIYMNSELQDVEIVLYKTKVADSMNLEEIEPNKNFFLNVKNVTYNRHQSEKESESANEVEGQSPTHRLIVHGLKGAWTKDNRDIVLSLFDSYFKTQLLKRNLSTEALRLFKEQQQMANGNGAGGSPSKNSASQADKPSHLGLSKGNAANMLQKLINEVEQSENIVDTEQIENVVNDRVELYGIEACQTNDVLQNNWLIELINSQVVLRGCETDGYVIVSAAKTQIVQRIHRPVWKNRILYSKTTWQGSLECMQYYATVDAGGLHIDEFTWLDLDDIEDQQNREIADISDLVGSGRSVGGVVNSEAGGSTRAESVKVPIQLQRIVSRCRCKFFYASYGENADPNNYEVVPPLPQDDDLLPLEPWDREVAVDTFTLTHEQLEIFTNSQQYAMIMDLVNNLLLYVEPHKKEVYDKQQRIRFSMQLNSLEAQREPISELQEKVRSLLNRIKTLEKDGFVLYKKILSGYCREHDENQEQFTMIETELEKCKRELNVESENLSIMINCYKEAQLIASKTKERQVAAQESRLPSVAQVIRRNEVCFKQAGWRLTDSDGQLGLADIELNNFLYTKVSKNDDSVEHSFELGYIRVQNMIPNQPYRDVLQPTELQPNMPVDRKRALRILCIERAPVGGISVKEHLEVNVIPLTVGITYAFFKKMLKFFFPERNTDSTPAATVAAAAAATSVPSVVSSNSSDAQSEISVASSVRSRRIKVVLKRDESCLSLTPSYCDFPANSKITHIEKMRERASKNQTFVYIKIPEVPIKISYKGNKNKNLEDLHDVNLILPTFEYHNRTCTWLDLLMALKNDSKRVLVQQALRHKFQIIKTKPLPSDSSENKASASCSAPSVQANNQSSEDVSKARLLLGNIVVPPPKNTKSAKSILLFGSKNK